MAEIDEITVSYSRKVQLDQFEPIEHHVSMDVEIGDDEDPHEVYDEYAAEAEDMVERSIAGRVTAKKLESDDEGE